MDDTAPQAGSVEDREQAQKRQTSFWALAASGGERYGNYNNKSTASCWEWGEAGCACWPQQDSGGLRSRCSWGAEAGRQGQVTGAGPGGLGQELGAPQTAARAVTQPLRPGVGGCSLMGHR